MIIYFIRMKQILVHEVVGGRAHLRLLQVRGLNRGRPRQEPQDLRDDQGPEREGQGKEAQEQRQWQQVRQAQQDLFAQAAGEGLYGRDPGGQGLQ